MESRVIKVNPNRRPAFPFFATDVSNNVYFVKARSGRRGFVTAQFLNGNSGHFPLERDFELRAANLTKITRMRLTFMIGSNI